MLSSIQCLKKGNAIFWPGSLTRRALVEDESVDVFGRLREKPVVWRWSEGLERALLANSIV